MQIAQAAHKYTLYLLNASHFYLSISADQLLIWSSLKFATWKSMAP